MGKITKKNKKVNKKSKTMKNTFNSKKDTSKKEENIDKNTKMYYDKHFLGTKKLPITEIITFINDHYQDFEKREKEKKVLHQPELLLSDYFEIKHLFHKKDNKINIDESIEKLQDRSLDDLIADSLYLKSKTFFQEGKLNISDLKHQIGVDVNRIKIKINDTTYEDPNIANENITNVNRSADYFITMLMNYYENILEKIDLNQINKISILLCQNIFNLVSEMIILTIVSIIKPEYASVMSATKNAEITISLENQMITYFFQSDILVSYNNFLNPEYPCGKLDFILNLDIKNNSFGFKKFKLDIDMEKCNPDYVEPEEIENPRPHNYRLLYLIPALGITGGLVAIPFILGAIGGTKKIKLNKNKKNKKRKTNK
jgi:hypothetical protein